MARLQDFQTVTPTASDNLLIIQSQGQGLANIGTVIGAKMDKANPTGTGSLSLNRKSGTTTGSYSVTTGYNNEATGVVSRASGEGTKATGRGAVAEAINSQATGDYSISQGYGTIANHQSQVVFGQYNLADTSTAASTLRGNYIEIVGKGTNDANRSNARTLDWSGNEVLAGGLKINGNIDVKGISRIRKTEYITLDANSAQAGYLELTNVIDYPTNNSIFMCCAITTTAIAASEGFVCNVAYIANGRKPYIQYQRKNTLNNVLFNFDYYFFEP